MSHKEALITINGTTLTSAQSGTLRSALESFDADLADEGLGDDEHGIKMVEAYRARIAEIRLVLYRL